MWCISKYGVTVNQKYLHYVLSAALEQQFYHLNILFWSVFTKESETAEGSMEYMSNLEGLCPTNPFCDWFCYCICWYSLFCVCACILSQLTLQKAYIVVWKHFENTGIMKSRLSFLQKIAEMI